MNYYHSTAETLERMIGIERAEEAHCNTMASAPQAEYIDENDHLAQEMLGVLGE